MYSLVTTRPWSRISIGLILELHHDKHDAAYVERADDSLAQIAETLNLSGRSIYR